MCVCVRGTRSWGIDCEPPCLMRGFIVVYVFEIHVGDVASKRHLPEPPAMAGCIAVGEAHARSNLLARLPPAMCRGCPPHRWTGRRSS